MRSFQRASTLDPVPGSVVALLRRIDVASGNEARYVDQRPQLLASLRDSARVESITASNAIEGVVVDEGRVLRLSSHEVGRVRNRHEAEFAGYTAALDYLVGEGGGRVSVGLILHLHRLLYSFTDGRGGSFKSEDNVVVDRAVDGARRTRFTPVSAHETPFYVDELVDRANEALDRGATHPLIVIAAFALDFLCIHPFADGNGRIARLLTHSQLGRSGYGVGSYVSIEQLIFETKDDYYRSLAASTIGWFDDGAHDAWPWTRYLLVRVDDAYGRFSARVAAGISAGTKQDRVREYVLLQAPERFSIAEIRRAVVGVSDNTIRLVLAELKAANLVLSEGTGRGATWHRIGPGLSSDMAAE